MSDTAKAALKAVVSRLLGLAPITSLVSNRVFSHVPQNTTFPYITVRIESEPELTFNKSNMIHRLRIQAFSQQPTLKEALDLREAIYNALHRQQGALTLDAGSCTYVQFSGLADAFIEDDGKTYQSIIEFEMAID